MAMGTPTFGSMSVDWEDRVDYKRLRNTRLAGVKSVLSESEAGSLLCFDMTNVRYVSATHIGTWAMDKMSRFSLLMQNVDLPVVWDFGSAAKHHRLYHEWYDESNSRADPTLLRGAIAPETGRAAAVAKKIYDELEANGLENDPVAIDIVELPILFELQKLGVTVIDGQQIMQNARIIKSQDEIMLLTHAAMLVDAVYDEIYRAMRPGVRESDIVALASKFLYENGSEFVEGVNAISGERCSPHPHVFSDRMLRPGDPAYYDILHSYMGYRTCYYRTFVVGSASQAQVDAYKKCRDILDGAIDMIKPGVTTAEVVAEWPKAQEFGFPDEEAAFALQYGHGIGMAIWEKPVFSRMVSFDHPEEIKEGMVFALETFWPASDGWSAARIEEELVVTADGCEVISRFPAEQLMVTGGNIYVTASGPLSSIRDTESQYNNPRIFPNGRENGATPAQQVANGAKVEQV